MMNLDTSKDDVLIWFADSISLAEQFHQVGYDE